MVLRGGGEELANLLTGDYEAVLQLSGRTVNRLLASMHQNGGQNTDLPSFPHSIGVRLGDTVEIDGVRGTAWAQVGAPRIELIDGATDRFWLEADARVRFRPDRPTVVVAHPGGGPVLPPNMAGTVRATYVVEDIDPNMPGWGNLGPDYVAIRVLEDSISFTGVTASDDAAPTATDQTMNDRITRQLRALLTTTFEPSPHRLSSRFRSFKTLDQAPGAVDVPVGGWPYIKEFPVGGSGVVLPVGVTTDPVGSLDSLGHVLLADYDFAVAVSEEAIMGLIEPTLSNIRRFTYTTPQITVSGGIGPVNVDVFSTVYHVWVNSADAVWVSSGSYADIAMTVTGHAHTDSALPDADFTVDLKFRVDFDAGEGELKLSAGVPSVDVRANLPDDALGYIRREIGTVVKQKADDAVQQSQASLAKFTAGRDELVTQLQTIDDQADAQFLEGTFIGLGVVLRGSIDVSDRRPPSVSFTRVDSDALSAFQSWIPGGRIDSFEWSWTWFHQGHDPGEESYSDRYVLRRDPGQHGRFRASTGRPLPGLDGAGRVCVTLRGEFLSATTGEVVPIEVGPVCTLFSITQIPAPPGVRLFLRDLERGHVVDVTARGRATGPSTNTLVVSTGDAWTDDEAKALVGGVEECRRQDAGLLVLVLVPKGRLDTADGDTTRLRELAARLEAPMIVSEDVHGGWSKAFAIPTGTGQPSWRLLMPSGGILWAHDGRLTPGDLAVALDTCLYPSARSWPTEVHAALKPAVFSPAGVAALFHQPEGDAHRGPPLWGIRPADVASVVSAVHFVQHDADEVHRVAQHKHVDGAPNLVIVVDGADRAEAHRLEQGLGRGVTVVADRDGALARTFGVRVWPTTVAIGDHQVSYRRGGT